MYVRKKNEKLNSSRNDSYLLSIGFIKYTNSAHKKMAEEKLMDYQAVFRYNIWLLTPSLPGFQNKHWPTLVSKG